MGKTSGTFFYFSAQNAAFYEMETLPMSLDMESIIHHDVAVTDNAVPTESEIGKYFIILFIYRRLKNRWKLMSL